MVAPWNALRETPPFTVREGGTTSGFKGGNAVIMLVQCLKKEAKNQISNLLCHSSLDDREMLQQHFTIYWLQE